MSKDSKKVKSLLLLMNQQHMLTSLAAGNNLRSRSYCNTVNLPETHMKLATTLLILSISTCHKHGHDGGVTFFNESKILQSRICALYN